MIDFKAEYLEKLELLENFLDFSIDVSDQTAGISVTDNDWYKISASQLYIRLTVSAISIIRLLPENRYFPAKWNFWDFSSVAALTRNFMENYHTLFFICIEEISSEEKTFRRLVLKYHENNQKFKIYSNLNADEAVLKSFADNLPNDELEIREHSFFATLDKSKQKEILKGELAIYSTNNEISGKLAFKTDDFKSLYKYFSNHTHTAPLSFFSISNENGRGNENEKVVTSITLAIDILTRYLTAAIIDMIKLFPSCESKLDIDKSSIVKKKFDEYL